VSNMSYCRHENTASDLADVWEDWENTDPYALSEHERRGRLKIIVLVREMHEQFEADDTYDEVSA